MGGKGDWEGWYIGLLPVAIFVLITAVLINKQILSWKDPLGELQQQAATESAPPSSEVTPLEKALDEQQVSVGIAPEPTKVGKSSKSAKGKKGGGMCWPVGC